MSESVNFVLPHWLYWGWLAIMPIIYIWLERRSKSSGGTQTPDEQKHVADEETALEYLAEQDDPTLHEPGNRVTRLLDWISEQTGVFVALWTVNAVCAYFYEVISRYLFDAPTIWVHQASYLLFGMQYLLAGGFAMLHGDHVRVDVVYIKLNKRAQVGMDIFTSVFFFIFTLALIGTSWRFFSDSFSMLEVTEETWRIQYYPVKATMLVGAIILGLAGISKLIKDIRLYQRLGKGRRI